MAMATGLIPIEDARQIVLSQCSVLSVVAADIADAVGCVLACEVVAQEDVPPFANSAVDGYAVIAADLVNVPCDLPVVGEIAAGAAPDRVLGRGEAIRIMTGAPVPQGADAIVMVENTERLNDGLVVRINATATSGQAIRDAGDDIKDGTTVFGPGTIIRPAVAGVLASVNARSVDIVPRARVAVLSTGDELIDLSLIHI